MRHRGQPPDGNAQEREVRERVLRLRPEIRAVFRSYGIPRAVGTAYLREAVELAVILCHRVRDPHRYLLDTLERRSRAYWQRVMALEGNLDLSEDETEEDDDGGPPDP